MKTLGYLLTSTQRYLLHTCSMETAIISITVLQLQLGTIPLIPNEIPHRNKRTRRLLSHMFECMRCLIRALIHSCESPRYGLADCNQCMSPSVKCRQKFCDNWKCGAPYESSSFTSACVSSNKGPLSPLLI